MKRNILEITITFSTKFDSKFDRQNEPMLILSTVCKQEKQQDATKVLDSGTEINALVCSFMFGFY